MTKIEIGGMICEEVEKDEFAEAAKIIKLATCPPDPRFQQQNKTKWCYRMFIDFHRCAYLLGDDNEHCKYFERCYKSICPNEWINNWNDQIDSGTFPRDLTKEMEYCCNYVKCKDNITEADCTGLHQHFDLKGGVCGCCPTCHLDIIIY